MLVRGVTKSAVIITIAVSMGLLVSSQPVDFLSSARASPPSKEWEWENMTVVVRHDINIGMEETFEIRNSTIVMDSSKRTIGIWVTGYLLVVNSTIRNLGENGYYFEILGVAEIENSKIEGVKSIDPIGVGMIVSPLHFQARGSTISSMEKYAMTFYFPLVSPFDFIVDSDVAGVSLVMSHVNAKNSTLGDLHFRRGLGEFELYGCTYDSVKVDPAAFGHIYIWRYLQVHTSLPESDLTITSVDESMVDKVVTDENGDYAFWWFSQWMMLDPMPHVFVIDNNPFTFQANKTVVNEYMISGHGRERKIIFTEDFYGETVQDLEESALVEVRMEPVSPDILFL
jgi:hypothetical protein